MSYDSAKQQVLELASHIASCAEQLQHNISRNEDYLECTSDLAKAAQTMVFALGEMYASEKLEKELEDLQTKLDNTKTVVSAPPIQSKKIKLYFRDALGRFARKG